MNGRRKFIKQSALASLGLFQINGLDIFITDNEYVFESEFIKLRGIKNYPGFNFFSTDSLGEGDFFTNSLLPRKEVASQISFKTVVNNKSVQYQGGAQTTPQWKISCEAKKIKLESNTSNDSRYVVPFEILMSQKSNYSTVLGKLEDDGTMNLPCILHFPGMGSFKISSATKEAKLKYDALNDASRSAKDPYVSIAFPAATSSQKSIQYELESVTIYPKIPAIEENARWNSFKRDLINIFQLNPRRNVLANNSGSDNCVFTIYLYAEAARRCPDLFEGFPAMNLIKNSLERYISGYSGYGFVGHPGWRSIYNSLDSYPSLVIATCYYILEQKDYEWGQSNFDQILDWANKMLKLDKNGDGLIEYGYSGNSGSWRKEFRRPANWWDCIGFGHDDAYSNALAFRACSLLSKVARKLDRKQEVRKYKGYAGKIKSVYFKTFYNPESNLLAGWKSEDGQLHDYAFTFVNSIAVCYELLTKKQSVRIMDALLAKMKDVGYTNFRLGLPGNLIPIRSDDYTHTSKRWGYGEKEDGSDGFQIYENGGASGCYAFFTIKALIKVGRKEEAANILFPMMDGFTNREFQGECSPGGMSKDWKTWKGECWGYEGFLVDNYLTLFAAVDYYSAKKID